MSRLAIPLPLLHLWYDLLLHLRLRVSIHAFAIFQRGSAPRWLSVRLPLLLATGLALTQGFNARTAVKLMVAGASYALVVATLRSLANPRLALIAGSALVALVLVVGIVGPVGDYDEVVPPARFVDEPQTFRTRIHTFPASPRWGKIRAAAAKPYLFVSSPTAFEGEMALVTINGVDLGPIQSLPGAMFGSGAWSVPLPWSMIEGRDEVVVELHFKPGPKGGFWFAAASALPISDRMPVQHFKVGDGPWLDVATVMKRPQMMTVELRFADAGQRNIGILY